MRPDVLRSFGQIVGPTAIPIRTAFAVHCDGGIPLLMDGTWTDPGPAAHMESLR